MSVRFSFLSTAAIGALSLVSVVPALAQQGPGDPGQPQSAMPPGNDDGRYQPDDRGGYDDRQDAPQSARDHGDDDRYDDRQASAPPPPGGDYYGPDPDYDDQPTPVPSRPNYGTAQQRGDQTLPPDQSPRPDYRQQDYAADRCADAAEEEAYHRGVRAHVEGIDRVFRDNGEWRVEGHLWTRGRGPGSFSCGVRQGRVRYVQLAGVDG